MRRHPFFHFFARDDEPGRHGPRGHGGFSARGRDPFADEAFDEAPHGHGHGRGPLGPFARRGGPRRRLFDQGDLRLVALKLIAEKPSYGYEIIKRVEERVGGAYAPSPGVVYPTLTLLEELGAIAVRETDGPRKLFAATPEGEAMLEQNAAAVASIFARMDEQGARHGGGRAPQIVRAIENLRMALRLRLEAGPLGAQEVERVAAALDRAAQEIARRDDGA
ncbi:PadR family transcriptional regulator [Methylocella sp.]|uniref:PadR family transcriptional regulator n=1 Tax=Methylocella sp. TaxID=1978226 RepID=UPI003784C472